MIRELTHLTAADAAKRLLGCELVRTYKNSDLKVRIVETEAYDQSDASSHSYNGQTPRTDVMFGPAGHLYVYFTYGMHFCCNVVVGEQGYGAAVLIRAVEPLSGYETMRQWRDKQGVELSNGPAKLCQALRIDQTLNGHDLQEEPLRLILRAPLPTELISQTTRIGISKAKDVNWRFYITRNEFVSHLQRPQSSLAIIGNNEALL